MSVCCGAVSQLRQQQTTCSMCTGKWHAAAVTSAGGNKYSRVVSTMHVCGAKCLHGQAKGVHGGFIGCPAKQTACHQLHISQLTHCSNRTQLLLWLWWGWWWCSLLSLRRIPPDLPACACRVLHIPGQEGGGTVCAAGCSPHTTSSSSHSHNHNTTTIKSSSADHDDPELGAGAVEYSEDLLQSLIGSDPPPLAAAAGSDHHHHHHHYQVMLLMCEALVSVELPAGQLQLMVAASALQPQPAHVAAAPAEAAAEGGNSAAEQQDQEQEQGMLIPVGPPVKHLPPIRVKLQLPVDYPSNAAAPPVVQLHASWLNPQQQQALQVGETESERDRRRQGGRNTHA